MSESGLKFKLRTLPPAHRCDRLRAISKFLKGKGKVGGVFFFFVFYVGSISACTNKIGLICGIRIWRQKVKEPRNKLQYFIFLSLFTVVKYIKEKNFVILKDSLAALITFTMLCNHNHYLFYHSNENSVTIK